MSATLHKLKQRLHQSWGSHWESYVVPAILKDVVGLSRDEEKKKKFEGKDLREENSLMLWDCGSS